jgi:4-amino-4-deoxy-L-arabinose transferase-like glycosyltransferase
LTAGPPPETQRAHLGSWWHVLRSSTFGCQLWEFLVLFIVCGYFLLCGLVPWFGGARLGLVGADEPRYAQIAREMLTAHMDDCHEVHARILPSSLRPAALHASYDCLVAGTITPVLYGRPWLEKPALYYWRAMSFFKEFGISGWAARLPSASGAFMMVLLIFLHLRRFRPGGHLDAAIMTVTSLAVFAFARGASTDMQLAAPFCIGMLGWYAWYETGKKFWLFDLYFFNAAATLAKGPVAPFLALIIICIFLGLRKEWAALRRTIWIPGVLLYLLMVLPWYIAVARRNPTFLRQFFLEHNLERFATNRYQHHQPWYFYAVVLVLGLMPWTALAFRALWDAFESSLAEWKVRLKPMRYVGHMRAGDAFPEFLIIWAFVPVVFFSFSQSKLPGYILPCIPPLTILTGDYLFRARRNGVQWWLVVFHAVLSGILAFVVLLCPQYMVYERIVPQPRYFVIAALGGVATALFILAVVKRKGVRMMRLATTIPLVFLLFFLLEMNGHLLDLNYSSRPLAREIAAAAPNDHVLALVGVRRDLDYGLAFYRNERLVHYDTDGVPEGAHVLVIAQHDVPHLPQLLDGRSYEPLFLYPWQGLAVYRVAARAEEGAQIHPDNRAGVPNP